MTSESEGSGEDQPSRGLRGYSGYCLDQLLAYAATQTPDDDLRARLWTARRIIRSGRPDHEFIWRPEARHELVAAVDLAQGKVHDLLHDAIDVATGDQDASAVGARWDIHHKRVPTDPRLELAQFVTTRSYQSIAEAFGQHVQSDEPMDVIIRGHLWIEAAIIELVRRRLAHPARLDDARFSFVQHLALAHALGVVEEDELRAALKINRLRNRMAHRLDDPVTEQDQAELMDVCSARLRGIAGVADQASLRFPGGIAAIVATLVIGFHNRVDQMDASARYNAYLAKVMQNTITDQD